MGRSKTVDGDPTYRLKLPDKIEGLAQNLADLAGEDLQLSSDMVKLKVGPSGEKIHIQLKLPRRSERPTDWEWFRFSTRPSERVRQLLSRGDISFREPRFHVERGDLGREYYLSFRLSSPGEPGGREARPAARRSMEDEAEGWSTAAKAAVVLLVLVFLSFVIYTFPGIPLRVVGSSSMKPTLEKGDLVYTKRPGKIEAGDIVVIDVPKAYREKYGYPSRLIHRVVEVDGRYLKTEGDASGPDPFKSKISTVTGVYSGFKIPQVGYVFLFFQTMWGKAYAVIVISSLTLYTTLPPWLEKRRRRDERVSRALKSTVDTRNALSSFSSAMNEYAAHLKSHTSAIRSLASTTEHLDRTVTKLERRTREPGKSED